MKIIVDSREQLPLWTRGVIRRKLDVGDYSSKELEGVVSAERKSPGDLYCSVIQNHTRFRKEIIRAKEQGIKLVVFVECSEKMFYSKKWKGGFRLKTEGNVLAKIIATIQKKYDLPFVWCDGRENMKTKIKKWLDEEWLRYNKQKERMEV